MRFGITSFSAGLAASLLAHLLLLGAVLVPHKRQTVHGETLSVEVVSPQEVPGLQEPEPPQQQQQAETPKPREETQPDFSQLQLKPPVPNEQHQSASPQQQQQPQQQQRQAQQQQQQSQPQAQQSQPPQQAQQQPPQQPQPQQQAQQPPPEQQQQAEAPPPPAESAQEALEKQHVRLAEMLGLPAPGETKDYKFDDLQRAEIKAVDMAAFHAHLKKCWTLPAGYSADQNIEVIIRVPLRQNGMLAREPSIENNLIKGPKPEVGIPLIRSAFAALKQCQPYNMLPADKYKEWQVIDLNFSPHVMAGG